MKPRMKRDLRAATPTPIPITIALGSTRDYSRLAHLHYRAGVPAVPVRVLVAHAAGVAAPVGVLVVAMPPLNGPWRELAWPGRYGGPDKRGAARRINDELRIIARVVVDPCCRGLRIATSLVRAYLTSPLTPATEALAAARGRACPFFERAGMTAYALPPSGRDARLADALAHASAHRVPWSVAARGDGPRRPSVGTRFLIIELRRWANGARATRRLVDAPPAQLFRAASAALTTRSIAYAYSVTRDHTVHGEHGARHGATERCPGLMP